MLYFPQLPSGAIGQFPIKKRRSLRTIVNQVPDGHKVKLTDPGAQIIQWQLAYKNLADSEIDILQQFFAACEGKLNGFTFLDPVGNLLVWSEALSQPAWEASGLLQVIGDIDDPCGDRNASRVTNATGTDLTIQQMVNAPGWFAYCCSSYVRSQSVNGISLFRQAGASMETRKCASYPIWSRISFGGRLNTTAESVAVGMIIAAGQSVDVFGFQLEPQLAPAPYKPTFSASGVYPNAHFSDDTFSVTTIGPNRHTCTLTITAR